MQADIQMILYRPVGGVIDRYAAPAEVISTFQEQYSERVRINQSSSLVSAFVSFQFIWRIGVYYC